MSDYEVLVGDCLESLRKMEDQSVNCCVTSPPYFGLRDYGVDGQIGLEQRAPEYVDGLVAVFTEVLRALRDDGVLFVNIGDTYAGFKDGKFTPHSQSNGNQRGMPTTGAPHRSKKLLELDGFRNKELMGIPWRFAFAMRDAGWYLRQEIIWSKPNYTPEKVRDRFVRSHEHIFLFTKRDKYWFDGDAVRIPVADGGDKLRNDVWAVPVSTFKGAHFATFPPDLIEPCILAGCPAGGTVLDPFGGSGTTAGVALAHGRRAILCELNPEYAELVPARVESVMAKITEARISKQEGVDNTRDTRNTPHHEHSNPPEQPPMNTTRAPAEQVQAVTNQIKQLFEQRRQIMQRAADEAATIDQQIDNGLAWAVQNAGGDELVALSILSDEQAAINDALGAGMVTRLKALDEQIALYGNALMLETGMTTFKAHGKTARREMKTKLSATRAELDAFIRDNPKWLSLYVNKVSVTAIKEYADAVTEKYLTENPGKTAADVPADLLLPPGVKAFSEFTFTIKSK